MIEDRILIREVMTSDPNHGDSVRTKETVNVQIRWPGGGEPVVRISPDCPNVYFGEWVLLPPPIKAEPESVDGPNAAESDEILGKGTHYVGCKIG